MVYTSLRSTSKCWPLFRPSRRGATRCTCPSLLAAAGSNQDRHCWRKYRKEEIKKKKKKKKKKRKKIEKNSSHTLHFGEEGSCFVRQDKKMPSKQEERRKLETASSGEKLTRAFRRFFFWA